MMNLRDWMPLLAMPLMLIAVQIIALLLASPMQEAGLAAFEDPTSVANPLIFIGLLLVFTLVMLFLIKKGVKRVIALFIGFSLFLVFVYIFGSLSLLILGATIPGAAATLVLSVGATALLYLYPEWYVIDVLGVLIAGGVASVFGISLSVIPVIVLLILLAVYDAISVYRTKHMITLAEGVMDMKTPILVVIPKRRDYSFIREGVSMEEGKERGAFIMGLGDLIMPSILIVSSYVFLEAAGPLPIPLPTLGAMAGSLIGLAVLLVVVMKGNPQAGLPPLNGGAIGGFLVGCALSGLLGWGVCI
jgi:presenilin-like A22 family membrane protease